MRRPCFARSRYAACWAFRAVPLKGWCSVATFPLGFNSAGRSSGPNWSCRPGSGASSPCRKHGNRGAADDGDPQAQGIAFLRRDVSAGRANAASDDAAGRAGCGRHATHITKVRNAERVLWERDLGAKRQMSRSPNETPRVAPRSMAWRIFEQVFWKRIEPLGLGDGQQNQHDALGLKPDVRGVRFRFQAWAIARLSNAWSMSPLRVGRGMRPAETSCTSTRTALEIMSAGWACTATEASRVAASRFPA